MDASISTAEALEFHLHPSVWIILGGLAGAYLVAVRLGARRAAPSLDSGIEDADAPHVQDTPGPRVVTTRHYFSFLSGVLAMWLGADWPLHELSEDYLFSAHMIQHMLFTFVGPPLLLLGMPAWLLRDVLDSLRLTRPVRVMTRPLVALLTFNAVIAITHWPAVVDASLRSEAIHFLVHLVLVLVALQMWWPVVDPLPELRRLSDPGKMLYLFLQSILPTVPASFLTFADGVIYDFYASVPRLWGLDVVTDQRIAGLIMKLGGGLLLWAIITFLFFSWNSKEERGQSVEVAWDDFERELRTWDLRK